MQGVDVPPHSANQSPSEPQPAPSGAVPSRGVAPSRSAKEAQLPPHGVELPLHPENQSPGEAEQPPPGAVSTPGVAPSSKAAPLPHRADLLPDSAKQSPSEEQPPQPGPAPPPSVASSPEEAPSPPLGEGVQRNEVTPTPNEIQQLPGAGPSPGGGVPSTEALPGEALQPPRKQRPLPQGVELTPNKETPSPSEVLALPEVWPFLRVGAAALEPLPGEAQLQPKEVQPPSRAEPPSPQGTQWPPSKANATLCEVQSLPGAGSPPEGGAAPLKPPLRKTEPPPRVAGVESLLGGEAAPLEPLSGEAQPPLGAELRISQN